MLRQARKEACVLGQGILGRTVRNRIFMKIIMPDDVSYIINKLISNGYEAYAVGGCVRDSIIRREPGDWDITTSALPGQVKSLFRHTVDTGIKHGTVTVMRRRTGYEVTTYRVDGEYEDKRHPSSVEFTASLLEDLKRRDFTVNAMAYNDGAGLVDEFNGREDLENGIIRCVGKPEERFGEDALRMLRAIRFSAQLGFEIERETAAAIISLAPSIASVSRERVHAEFGKILLSPHPEMMGAVYEYGLSRYIFPELDAVPDRETALRLVGRVPESLTFRYAALLYGLGADAARRALKSLKLDNRTVEGAEALVRLHGMELTKDATKIRRLASEWEYGRLAAALEFERCYYGTVGEAYAAENVREERRILDGIIQRGDCLDIRGLAVDGGTLIGCGIAPGIEVGKLLKKCLELVLENPALNTREYLLKYLGLRE